MLCKSRESREMPMHEFFGSNAFAVFVNLRAIFLNLKARSVAIKKD